MSWFKGWWKSFWHKGVFFSWTGCWPGEGDLPHRNWWADQHATKEDCEKEIRDSLKKEEKDVVN